MVDHCRMVQEEGYTIVRGGVPTGQIEAARMAIEAWRAAGGRGINSSGGISVPDFVRIPDLNAVAVLKEAAPIHDALAAVLGSDYRFCSHNDIGIGRTVGWHKDKLNGEYAKYQKTDIWRPNADGERHQIVKVLIYLQDQHDSGTSLHVVPGSHTSPSMATNGAICVRLNAGDALIFDQRITHRGARVHNPQRILVAFGFGKNNVFTDEFERGTIARQQHQYTRMV